LAPFAGVMVPSSATSAAASKAGISKGGLTKAHELKASKGKCTLTPITVPKRVEAASLVKLLDWLARVREEGARSTSQFSMASDVLSIILCSSVKDPANLTFEKSIRVARF